MSSADIAAVREAFRLAALRLHCRPCEVDWTGGGRCWSCGAFGEPGPLL